MIAILKNGTTQEQKEHLIRWLKNQNLDVHVSEGTQVTILGLEACEGTWKARLKGE